MRGIPLNPGFFRRITACPMRRLAALRLFQPAGLYRHRKDIYMKILMLGDCVGRPGRTILQEIVPKKQQELGFEMIVANGENASGGRGLNRNGRDDLYRAGVDVITMGNHTWDNRELAQFIDDEYRIVRPANYPGECP